MFAASSGDPECVRELLEKGAAKAGAKGLLLVHFE